MSTIQYNRIIRKIIVGFGNIFNNITMLRYNPDQSEQERFLVPVTYAQKELYVQRLIGDPNLDKKTQMTLPRITYEMSGFSYDASRKQNTNIQNFSQGPTGLLSQYNPVPYNFDFNLYIYVRNIDDATQILEYILPYFTPDYTIKLNLIPEMGAVKEIPIVLNTTSQEINYEGNRDSDPRLIIWTLNFTVKGFIYGQVNTNTGGLILNSITNIYNDITASSLVEFTMNGAGGSGTYQSGEIVFQGYSIGTAIASAQVVSYNSRTKILTLQNIVGNFISSLPIVGVSSSASYQYSNYTLTNGTLNPVVTIDSIAQSNGVTITENNINSISIPGDAQNSYTSNITYITTITENSQNT